MEVKACMGCFVEWDRERDECPVCGWSPQKPLEEDKNGWHQGKIIAKRFLLGNCYLKKKDFVIWRTYDSLTIRPGEERSVILEYEINQPTYDSWYSSSHTVAVSFTCGNQRVTYTKNSRSDEITVSDIETL